MSSTSFGRPTKHKSCRLPIQSANPAHANRSVAEVARASGFTEAAHFSRAFRAPYGVPPSAVRGATR
ncbi:helix-turn-helix domain-containing protein [Microbacterium lacus]|uniref:helix-turn-helix domain-containing protein n=1 Tax=Microbacterium lacus TaxID=415217 RepID=UPI00384C2461